MRKISNLVNVAGSKANGALIGAKIQLTNSLCRKKTGANQYLDIAILALVGLICGAIFKEQIGEMLSVIISKISSNVSAWGN